MKTALTNTPVRACLSAYRTDAMSTYFTADTQFGQELALERYKRPFRSVEEMDSALIKNWNAQVTPYDTVFHLGNFSTCGGADKYFPMLDGSIILVAGDEDGILDDSLFDNAHEIAQQTLLVGAKLQHLVLCHYAMRVWPKSHQGSWHLHASGHRALPDDPNALSMNVGVDAWNYTPVSLEQVAERMDKKAPTWSRTAFRIDL